MSRTTPDRRPDRPPRQRRPAAPARASRRNRSCSICSASSTRAPAEASNLHSCVRIEIYNSVLEFVVRIAGRILYCILYVYIATLFSYCFVLIDNNGFRIDYNYVLHGWFRINMYCNDNP